MHSRLKDRPYLVLEMPSRGREEGGGRREEGGREEGKGREERKRRRRKGRARQSEIPRFVPRQLTNKQSETFLNTFDMKRDTFKGIRNHTDWKKTVTVEAWDGEDLLIASQWDFVSRRQKVKPNLMNSFDSLPSVRFDAELAIISSSSRLQIIGSIFLQQFSSSYPSRSQTRDSLSFQMDVSLSRALWGSLQSSNLPSVR